MKLAFSYVRFSNTKQAEGDSVRRQTERAEAWAKKHGYTIDERTVYHDLGNSGFDGTHRMKGALSRFTADVRDGNIPAGAVMLVENIDRLSREDPWEFMGLIGPIVKAGITIVLTDKDMTINKKTDLGGIITVLVDQSRAHEETKRTADKIQQNWNNWRRNGTTKSGAKVRPGSVPFWISRTETGYKLNEKAEWARQIVDWTLEGYGCQWIQKELRRRKVKLTNRKGSDGFITAVYLQAMLRKPILWGYCVAQEREHYYPWLILREKFQALQAALKARGEKRKGKPRQTDTVHLLSGLLVNYTTGGTYVARRWPELKRFVYHPYDMRTTNETAGTSFPIAELETAVLDCVREINPADLVGKKKADVIGGLLAEEDTLKTRLVKLEAEIEEEPSATIAKVIRRLEGRLPVSTTAVAEASSHFRSGSPGNRTLSVEPGQ